MIIDFKKKIVTYSAIVLLVLTSVFSINLIIQQKKGSSEIEKLKREVELRDQLFKNAYELQKANWIHSLNGINDTLTILDIHNNLKTFSNLVHDTTLVYYFDSDMCSPCLEREIDNLKKIKNENSYVNLIIIMNGFTKDYVFRDPKFQDLKSEIFISKKPLFKAGKLTNSPVAMLIKDSDILFISHIPKNHNIIFLNLSEILNSSHLQ